MSIAKKTKENILSISLLSIFDKLASFVIVIMIARYLGKESYGEYAFAFALAHILPFLSDLGVNALLTRDVSLQIDSQREKLSLALGIKVMGTVLAFFLIWGLTQAVPVFHESASVILLLCSSQLVRVLSTTFIAIARANLEMKYEAYAGTLNRFVAVAGATIALFSGMGLIDVLWVFLLASLIELAYVILTVYRKLTPFSVSIDFAKQKQLILSALPFLLLVTLPVINYRLDSILLRVFDGKEATGTYNAAYMLILNLLIIQQIASRVLLPVLSRFYKNEKERAEKYSRQAFKALIVFGLLIILCVQIFGEQIIGLIFGGEYAESVKCLHILIFSVVFMFASQIVAMTLLSLKEEKKVVKGWCFAVSANVVLNLILIPQYSYIGACVATVVSEVILFAANYTFLVSLRKKPLLYAMEWVRLCLPFFAGIIFLTLIKQISPLMTGLLILIIYLSIMLAGRTFSRDELSEMAKFIRA